jgi:hypothetical protein
VRILLRQRFKRAVLALLTMAALVCTTAAACAHQRSITPADIDPSCVGPVEPGYDWITLHASGTNPDAKLHITVTVLSDAPGHAAGPAPGRRIPATAPVVPAALFPPRRSNARYAARQQQYPH